MQKDVNLFVLGQKGGQENVEKLLENVGNVKMDIKVIVGLVLAAVFAAFGFILQQWSVWASTTLVDLNERTAIIETELKHTNFIIAKNHEMLKLLVTNPTRTNYGNKSKSDKEASIFWK